LDERKDSVTAPPTAADEELAVERTRERLDALVTEIDHRRQRATDVRALLRRRPWLVAALALAAASGITAAVLLKVRARRKGRSLGVRTRHLREAVHRMVAAPDRVARSAPNLLGKVSSAAAAAVASKLAKSAAERAIDLVTTRARA
jgi:hypothetical protein